MDFDTFVLDATRTFFPFLMTIVEAIRGTIFPVEAVSCQWSFRPEALKFHWILQPVLESLFNKVASLNASKFINKRVQLGCFPVNIAKCLRKLLLSNPRLFLVGVRLINHKTSGNERIWTWKISWKSEWGVVEQSEIYARYTIISICMW